MSALSEIRIVVDADSGTIRVNVYDKNMAAGFIARGCVITVEDARNIAAVLGEDVERALENTLDEAEIRLESQAKYAQEAYNRSIEAQTRLDEFRQSRLMEM